MHCAICGRDTEPRVPVRAVRTEMAVKLDHLHPGWRKGGAICRSHLDDARRAHIESLLRKDRDAITKLDATVAEAIAHDQSLVNTLGTEAAERLSFGDRVADKVASLGGSWRFILGFTGALIVWIIINVILAVRAFDPFPFILLNLLLSCVAALQAPVIMMSQRRQEEKDRDRAENDYPVNLKAGLEIRLLHEKIDHMVLQQLEHLTAIQAIMLDASAATTAPASDSRP